MVMIDGGHHYTLSVQAFTFFRERRYDEFYWFLHRIRESDSEKSEILFKQQLGVSEEELREKEKEN